MSQDIISDCLNNIMNAKKSGKSEVVITRYSKLLVEILNLAKKYNYLDFSLENKRLRIKFQELGECGAIKPRFFVNRENLDKYTRRYLPAKNFGIMVVSTSKGLMTHSDAKDNKIGGCLIAYFY